MSQALITILNTVRANNSAQYQNRVPELTHENLADVGNAITAYENTKNEFLDSLVGRICFTEVSNRRFRNPLAILKSGGKPYGTDIEEIYTNPISAVAYDGSATSDLLANHKPDVKTIFHRMNRQDKYPVTISAQQLKTAFVSFNELEKFINSIMTALYSGDEMDEYILMRNLITSGISEGKVKTLELAWDGSKTASEDLVKFMKTLSNDFTFPKSTFNGYNVLNAEGIAGGTITEAITWTPRENQVLLIRSDVDACTDVDVLAKAFNMEKASFLERKIVVDDFGDTDTLCFLCDENMFKVFDDLYEMGSFNNGSSLTQNYWLHHWQTLSLSLFANGVAIKQATATATDPEANTQDA